MPLKPPQDTRPDPHPDDSLPEEKLLAGLRAALRGDSTSEPRGGDGATVAMERLAGGSSRIVLLDLDEHDGVGRSVSDRIVEQVADHPRQL